MTYDDGEQAVANALGLAVLSDGQPRTASEIAEAITQMSGDQRVAAIQNWLPVVGSYHRECDD